MEAINAIHSKTASKIEMMVSGWLKEFVGSCTAEIANPVSPRENKIVKIHEKLIAKIKFQARNDKRVKRPLGERGLSEDELFIDWGVVFPKGVSSGLPKLFIRWMSLLLF